MREVRRVGKRKRREAAVGDLKRLLGYLGPYRRDLLIAAVMIILETAFEMVIPVLMADIIDVGVANRDVAVILQRGIQMGVCALLALVGLFLTAVFYLHNLKGAILFGILATWILGMLCQMTGIYVPTPDAEICLFQPGQI